ncbi:FliM/FliN family flagellar motor switch protein [Gimesia panareensis]|uniref:FliM/FliN family flagellar motor switch protein n=1 Tax=Gimesia panareensis TaxID=2527978 RepID=UPI0011886B32|nr:FliM/FliN family flagellar motor switch protein [Gimesia panareensis]QDU47813.1 flagellar motor switch protein [Gimesia panareensis]
MSGFSQENVEAIFAQAGESMAAISDSLNQCFDTSYRLEMGESGIWSPEELDDAFRGPGLVVLFRLGDEAMAGLIPEGLPLPDWYTEPGESQSSRLQTLSMEWSMNLIPLDAGEAEEFKTYATESLLNEVMQGEPADWAALLRINVFPADAETDAEESDGQSPSAVIPVIWPLTKPPVTETAEAEPDPAPEPAATQPAQQQAAPAGAALAASPGGQNPLNRINKLPVQAIVKLASKKIEMNQLLSICPGSLITFDKPCEDPLEMYINNQVYCLGEAVKIGENFGLKIDKVGFHKEYKTKIIEF